MRALSLLFSIAVLALVALAAELPGLSTTAEAARSGGVVYFHRPAGFSGAFTRPWVEVDGQKIGSIGSGECHRLRLPAGRHQVVVRDQKSLLSRFGLNRINGATLNVWPGAELFVTVRPLQQPDKFNEPATVYELLVSRQGRRC